MTKPPLPRNAAFRVCNGTAFFAPTRGRKDHIGEIGRVGRPAIADDNEGASLERVANPPSIRHADRGVGAKNPQRLDAAVEDFVKEVDRFEARTRSDPWRVPEPPHPVDLRGIGEVHMSGELVGEPADLAPAHRVRLAGERQGAHARTADPSRHKVAIDDRVDFVGAGRGLVHPLRIEGHGALGRRKPIVEAKEVAERHIGDCRGIGGRRHRLVRSIERRCASDRAVAQPHLVASTALDKMEQQASKNRDIAARPQRQVKIGDIAGRGAPGIDDDNPRAARFPCRDKALVQHRMAPGHVAAHQHDEIGFVDILVAAGHDVLAIGADVPRDRRRHAQARIGVDVGAADEAFHQLVGHVVIFRQKLAGDVQRDGVWAVSSNDLSKTIGDQVERLVPAGGSAANLRLQQTVVVHERLAKRRPLGAKPAAIGGMVGVAAYRSVRGDDHSAPNAAIGARRLNGGTMLHAACARSAKARPKIS